MKKIGLFLLAIFFIAQSVTFSQTLDPEQVKKDLPKQLGNSNNGTEFWFSVPPCYEDVGAGENTVRLYVASGVRQPITVEIPGKGYASTRICNANEVIEFSIVASQGQPYSKGINQAAPPEQIYGKAGIHVTSLAPVVVYVMSRFQYTSDGFLAIPVAGLGNDYVVAAYPQYTAVGSGFNLPSVSNITAAFDDTEVTFIMGGLKNSRTTGGLTLGKSKTWKLNAGDVLCFANLGDGEDISGSRVKASKPVAVTSGNQCANVPSGVYACDFTCEMELPTSTWGKEYHVTPVNGRLLNPVIRVFAHPDYKNVKVQRDGKDWFALPNNNRGENQAFIERRIDDGGPRAVVVSANAPIYIMLYNPGQTDDQIQSDPFQYVLTPIEQYQKEIVFSTPNAKGSVLPFTRNFVNLVYALGDGDVIPDDLEFAIANAGKFEWRKVKDRFGANPGRFFQIVSTNGLKYAIKTLTLPTEGVYRIRAKNPFAAYAYGFSNFDSYGFPTSVAVGDLTKKDTIAPNPEFTVKCGQVFGADGTGFPLVTDLPNDVTNRSNLAAVYMESDTLESYNYIFETVDNKGRPLKLKQGLDERIFWKLTIKDPSKDARAKIIFVDKAGNDTSIVIFYNAFKVTLVENPINFGLLNVNDKRSQSFKAINQSDNEISVTKLQLKDGSVGFNLFEKDGITPLQLPFTIIGKAEKDFIVTFSQNVEGDFVDSIGIGDDCAFGYPLQVRASTGEPIILVEQDANFGQKPVNSTGHSWPFTVRNIGSANLIVTGFTLPASPEFVIKYNNVLLTTAMINETKPLTIKPGGIENFSVEFSPTAVKQYSDQIYFKSNAKKSDSIEAMTGEAVEPGLFAQGYSWGKKRVLSNNLYNEAVWVTNTGNANLTINDVTLSDPNDKNFQYSEGSFGAWKQKWFVGKTLRPAIDTIRAPVDFVPESIMDKSLDLTFTTNETKPAVAKLLGTGIIGRLKTENVDFGTTKLDNGLRIGSEEKENKVRFEINNDGNYIYGDTVTIQLPFTMNATEIVPGVKNGNVYGTQGFSYINTAINTNGVFNATDNTVKIYNTGDFVEFTAFFNGPGPVGGNFTTIVTSVSDAEADVTATLTGTTINIPSGAGILTTTPNVLPVVCVNDPTVQVGTIEVANIGDADLAITGITYSPAIDANSNPWSVKEDFAPAYFTLAETEKKVLSYEFKAPNTVGVYNLDVTVASNAPLNGTQTKTLRGETVSYSGALAIEGEGSLLQYGKDYVYRVNLTTATAPTLANVNKMTITISYPTQMFVYRGGIQLLNSAWEQDGVPTTANGVVTISLKSSSATPVSANTTPYIAIPLFTVLSSDPAFVQGGKGRISVTATANDCFPIAPTGLDVSPQAVCFATGRAVGGSGKGQGQIDITPNPVPSMGGKLSFSIGIQSTTTLIIYSSTGEEVTTMQLGVLQPADYEVTLPMDKLSSGSYTAKFVSGPYTEVKPFAVTK